MAQTFLSRFLAELRALEERLGELFTGLSAAVASDVLRAADAEGNIPIEATFALQETVGRRVMRVFVSPVAGGGRAPFVAGTGGVVQPLSPYARAVWPAIENVTRLPVEQAAGVMRRQLSNAPGVTRELMRANGNPFDPAAVFRPNPLARYSPPHEWVDPNGYRLSDRIWRTAGRTRRKLDLYLDESIAEGRGARAIANDLERFLQPGRKTIRTNKPYGTDASFDAMRLARTEVSRAHAQAAEMSANMNPFVDSVSVVLSLSHPKPDICDEAAAASPFPKDDIPARYQIPMHPHCLCHYRYGVNTENADAVIDDLRRDIAAGRQRLTAVVGPMQVGRFTRLLLGGGVGVTLQGIPQRTMA